MQKCACINKVSIVVDDWGDDEEKDSTVEQRPVNRLRPG